MRRNLPAWHFDGERGRDCPSRERRLEGDAKRRSPRRRLVVGEDAKFARRRRGGDSHSKNSPRRLALGAVHASRLVQSQELRVALRPDLDLRRQLRRPLAQQLGGHGERVALERVVDVLHEILAVELDGDEGEHFCLSVQHQVLGMGKHEAT